MSLDLYAITTLRELLVDTDATDYSFSDFQIQNALNDNRATIYYRNPYVLTFGLPANLHYNASLRVPPSEQEYSLLQAEPGGFSFQVAKFVRHWDSRTPPVIWVSGFTYDPSTYSVDYQTGRVTFDAQHSVGDWQPVNASFCYYKIYHAARMLLLMRAGSNEQPAKIQNGPDSLKFQTTKDAIAALDAIIADMSPAFTKFARKLY